MATTKHKTCEVVREGVKLIIPDGMSYDDARAWITRQEEAESAIVTPTRKYKAFPLDGAAALARAVARLHGWSAEQGSTVSLPLPGGGSLEVPWGELRVPGIAGAISCGMGRTREGLPVFVVNARTRKRDEPKVLAIMEATQHELDAASIYRGRAVRFVFPEDGEPFDGETAPEFLDLSKVDPAELILRSDVAELVETTVFTPLRHTAALRLQGIPLKRGILLAGKYGVGKTLLAYATAAHATAHGWTYLYARVDQLAQAIEFALCYEPCVIFAEDIDQLVGTDERTDTVNEVLNTIDGVNVKGREVMVILTTNHVERINQAMLRFGRLDTVIEIPPPDAAAAARLVSLYARGQLESGVDLRGVGAELDGQIPAMIREVVERAKLGAIARGQGKALRLSAHDLTVAARGMVRHQLLLAPKTVDARSDLERAATIVGAALMDAAATTVALPEWRPGPTAGMLTRAPAVDQLPAPMPASNGHDKGGPR